MLALIYSKSKLILRFIKIFAKIGRFRGKIYIHSMKFQTFCEKYCLDARSFEEKNARSMALAYERLLKGRTAQATRLFAYNHALNQQQKAQKANTASPTKTPAKPTETQAAAKGPWKVRIWNKNKVVKTLTVDTDKESVLRPKVQSLGVEWQKATIHDPKTMKTLDKFYNK